MEAETPVLLKKAKLEKKAAVSRDESRVEEEEALLALVAHRQKEVEQLKQKLAHYKSQLGEAEKKLSQSKEKLARFQSETKIPISNSNLNSNSSNSKSNLRPHNNVPPKVVRTDPSSSSSSAHSQFAPAEKIIPKQEKTVKRKIEEKEHKDLIPSLRSCSKPSTIRFQIGTLVPSQHKRKLRCLELCPTSDNLFVTSALDGVISLWQVQSKGSTASLLSSTDCLSPKERRWPEDIAWHPDGAHIISIYSADGGDSQISILDLNVTGQKRVTFLNSKPHTKGLINSISFTPWSDDPCFVTGGSDHSVILWKEREESGASNTDAWAHKLVHGNLHSSAVTGVCGLRHKKVVVSVGADKWVIGFDVYAGRVAFKHQMDSKCMSVLTNPCDFNLYLVQSGEPEKQLRLFDVRLRQTEIHSFGWKQVTSDSQSALINQSWSPDGWHVSSGSADPKIHIFDIRYDWRGPAQTMQAHQKRVFKAMWHQSIPLITSISSDLNIGLHKFY